MTIVSGPSSGVTGGTITVSNTVRNQGTGGTGNFYISLFLSADSTITTSDAFLGDRNLAPLAAGGESPANTTVTLPVGLAPGTYYLGAIADRYGQVVESDETNNALAGNQITVTVGADLTMTIVSGPSSGVTGGTITVSNTVRNQGTGGTGNFYVSLFLSADSTITTGDTFLGDRILAPLAAGGESPANTTVTLPVGLAPGTYYLGAIADRYGQVAESDETNNAFAGNQINIGTDTTPPTGSISINNGASHTNNVAVTLNLSATDDRSGVSEMRFSNDGAVWSTPEPYAATKSWALTEGDGDKAVYVKFRDGEGNWSAAFSDAIILDTIFPSATITAPTSVTTKDTTPLLSYTVSEGVAVVKVDGAVVPTASGESLAQLPDGPHTVRVEATDAAGNVGFAEVNFTVDSTMALAFVGNISASSHTINTLTAESSTIFYTINGPATTTLKIIPEKQGPTGVPVYQTSQSITAAGANLFTWNGRNSAGTVVPDEAYLYILEASDSAQTATYSPAPPTGTGTVTCSQDTYNPYKNDPLTISYSVAQPSRVDITIAWGTGTFKVMDAVAHAAGNYTFDWDGRNPEGLLRPDGGVAYCAVASLLRENRIVTTGDTVRITGLKTDPYQMHLSYGQFTKITYSLSRAANVTVKLISSSGTTITLLDGQSQSADSQELDWYGTDPADTTGKAVLVTEEGDYQVSVKAVNPATGSSSTPLRGYLKISR